MTIDSTDDRRVSRDCHDRAEDERDRLPRLLLLGPTLMDTDGAPRPIARSQVRRLATVLGADPGRTVATDQLIDALWRDRLPADPKAALAVVGSRLRSELDPFRDRLSADVNGWALDVDTDIVEFVALTDRLTNPATIATTDGRHDLERVIELWRGEPLTELADHAEFGATTQLLRDRRRVAAIALSNALIDEGSSHRAVELLSPLSIEHKTDELLGATLARALAELGRRTDALAVLGATRVALREVGLDASESTVELELDILRRSVEVGPTVTITSTRTSTGTSTGASKSDSTFVGRHDELAVLTEPQSGIVIIVGETGAGKTALMRQADRLLEQAQHLIVRATAPQYPERPADVVTQLVEQFIVDSPPDSSDPDQCAVLARLIPSLDTGGVRLTAVGRGTLVTGLANYLRTCCRERDAVLMIDDLHWIDTVSAEVISQLGDVFVVGTSRPIAGTAGEIVMQSADRIVELEPLTTGEIDELLELSGVGGTRTAHARRIADRSGGNALFARLLIDLVIDGMHATALPGNILVAVQHRLDALSQRARRTLCIASIFGVAAPVGGIVALSPSAPGDLSEAADIGLVAIDDDTLTFVHQVVHEVVAAMLADGELIEYHERAGEYLQANGGSPVEIAQHFDVAAPLDPLRAVDTHIAAAKAAADAFDWELVAHHAAAGEKLARQHDPVLAATCVVWIGRAQRVLHRNDVEVGQLLDAALAAKQAGHDSLFAEAIVGAAICGWELGDPSIDQRLHGLHRDALQLALPVSLGAELRAVASTFATTESHAEARSLFHEALSCALDLTDPTDQAAVLRYAKWGLGHPDDLATLGEAALLLSSVAGDDLDLFWTGATTRFAYGVMAADRAVVDDAVSDLRECQRTRPRATHRWDLAQIETAYALVDDQVEIADDWLARMFELASPQLSESWVASIYGVILVAVRRQQGRAAELLPVIDLALEQFGEVPAWRAAAAGAAAAGGQFDRARTELRHLREAGGEPFQNLTWTAAMLMMADAAVATGDTASATWMIARLTPYADRMAWTGVCPMGLVADALVGLTELVGDSAANARFRAIADDVRLRIGRRPTSPPLATVHY